MHVDNVSGLRGSFTLEIRVVDPSASQVPTGWE